ncbi:MAG TPA: glycosyltransferase family 39 protein [Acidimicrobiales bacterium]|nr:glycosyltransferase family 39 protein [Acidimicrobiales bacterium]
MSEAPEESVSSRAPAPRWWWAAIGALMAGGLAVRVGFVLIRQKNLDLVTGDAFWYHFQAKLVADGRGFLNPFDFFKNGIESPGGDHPPGFTLILASLDAIGIDGPQGQRLVMTLVGTASIAVIGLLARRLAGWSAGLIAAAIAAFYPNIWVNDGLLQVETVFILAIACSLLLSHRIIEQPSRSDVLWLSFALMVCAMTRPESILLYVLLLTPLVLTRTEWPMKQRIGMTALAATIPILAFAPWVAYNTTRYEELVLVSTGSGQTLAVGNCDLTYDGANLGYWDLNCIVAPQIDPPTESDPSVRDGLYREIAVDYITDHLGDLPKVVAARVARIWHLYKPGEQTRIDSFVEGRGGDVTAETALAMYYVLAPLAIVGLIIQRRRRMAIYPELVIVALVCFTAATTFGVTRYRAGAEVVIAVGAATAIDAAIGEARLRFGRRRSSVAPPP